jgi:hypothetical protein
VEFHLQFQEFHTSSHMRSCINFSHLGSPTNREFSAQEGHLDSSVFGIHPSRTQMTLASYLQELSSIPIEKPLEPELKQNRLEADQKIRYAF